MRSQLSAGSRVTVPMAAQVAGTGSVNGSSVDMAGFQAVRFVCVLATLTATQVTSLKAQGSDDNVTFTDLEGTLTGPAADADSGKCLVLDLFRPRYRYVRPVVNRATANAAIACVVADQYLAAGEPVAQAAGSVSASKVVANAPAGTA